MTKAFGDGWYGQFREIVAVLKEAILLVGLGNLMKMWFVLCRISKEIDPTSKCRVPDIANDCPQKSSELSTSKTIQISGSPRNLQRVINSLDGKI
jgi:hypothetical protein